MKYLLISGIICISLIFFSCSSDDSPSLSINNPSPASLRGQWRTFAQMPVPMQETAPAVLGSKVYFAGGIDTNGHATAVLQIYDSFSNTWSFGAPLPEPMHHNGVAAANGNIYVLGGYGANGSQTDYTPKASAYVYNPAADRWSAIASLSVGRGAHVALAYNGKIYLLGGIDPVNNGSPRNDIYDLASNTWSTGANLPSVRDHVSGAVLDSLLYVVGGQNFSGNTNIVEAYSPASDTWYTIPSMLTRRHFPAVGAINGRLYVAGGETGAGSLQWDRVNEEYNPTTRIWRIVTPLPIGRSHIGGAVINGVMYVAGGAAESGIGNFFTTQVNEGFTPQ